MSYSLFFRGRAEKDLVALPKDDIEKIASAISALSANPRPPGCKKLKDRPGWRIRVGDYRILYEILDEAKQINIERIGHRKEIYR